MNKNNLKKVLAKNGGAKVITVLASHLENREELQHYYDEVLVLSERHKELKHRERLGLGVDKSEFAELTYSLLNLINEIDNTLNLSENHKESVNNQVDRFVSKKIKKERINLSIGITSGTIGLVLLGLLGVNLLLLLIIALVLSFIVFYVVNEQ